MALNNRSCGDCANYDPMLSRGKETGMGRCVAKSTYPATEQKGQVFPPGVKRATPGSLADIKVVRLAVIESNCGDFKAKPSRPAASPAKAVR